MGGGFITLFLDFVVCSWSWCLWSFFSPKSGMVLKWRQMGFISPSHWVMGYFLNTFSLESTHLSLSLARELFSTLQFRLKVEGMTPFPSSECIQSRWNFGYRNCKRLMRFQLCILILSGKYYLIITFLKYNS